MSGDPEQEYFTDGITEDNITELARMTSCFNDQVEGIRSRFPSLQENWPTIPNAAVQ
jgi:hypothetical protein